MARSFNGTSDLIDVGAAHSFADATAFSFSTWVKGSAQSDGRIYSEGTSVTTNQFSIGSSASGSMNTCRFLIVSANSVKLDSTGTAVILNGAWHHLAITLTTGRGWTRYVDGATDGSGTYSAVGWGPDRASIGCLDRNTNSFFFSGKLEQTALWGRTLSAKEVASLANGLPASHLGPKHYWPLWGVDSPEPDIGNG